MLQDLQEASSIRYGVWLRLAFLSSGRWAVYHSTEDRTGAKETGSIQVFDSLDAEYLKALSIHEQAKEEEHRQARGTAAVQQVATTNLEEMGL